MISEVLSYATAVVTESFSRLTEASLQTRKQTNA